MTLGESALSLRKVWARLWALDFETTEPGAKELNTELVLCEGDSKGFEGGQDFVATQERAETPPREPPPRMEKALIVRIWAAVRQRYAW